MIQGFCRWLLYKKLGWTKCVTVAHPDKFIICLAPHTSNWDFIIGQLYAQAEGFKINFLMKREWFFWPLGVIFRSLGGIPVWRSKHTSMTDNLAETAKTKDSFKLCITPEGTRSPNTEWKKGFYFIALKAEIPILLYGVDYEKKKIYVTGIDIVNDTIELERVKKQGSKLVRIKTDHILNNIDKPNTEVMVVDRRTDKYLTEYYLTLPYGLKLEKIPQVSSSTLNTVITRDLTIRLGENGKESKEKYFANVAGDFSASSYKAADMIKVADEGMGYVLDIVGNLVWERGRVSASAKAEDVDVDYVYDEDDSVHSAIRLFLTAKGIYISTEDLNKKGTIMDILRSQSEISPINLTGVDFDNILYYIAKGSPVIAMQDGKTAVLLTAYTPQKIEIMNAKTGKKSQMERKEAEKMFKAAGNVYISALN